MGVRDAGWTYGITYGLGSRLGRAGVVRARCGECTPAMPTLGPHADALGHAGALQMVPATKQDRTLEWLRWLERTQHAPVCALHVRPGLPVALVGDRLYPAGRNEQT